MGRIKMYALSVRLSDRIREALERARADQTRSLGGQVAFYVKRGLAEDGFLRAEEEVRGGG